MTEQDNTPFKDDETARARREAAAWLLKFEDGEADESAPAYLGWLNAAPAHAEAMAKVQAAWTLFGDHATAPEVVKARSLALDRSGKTAARRWSLFRPPPWVMKRAVAAALVVVTVIPASLLILQHYFDASVMEAKLPAPDLYKTEIGETRIVTLADNTRVSLDASTVLSVVYTDGARDTTLEAGQAHFDVAKDYRRPFRVTVGDQTVVATGTAFNVELVGGDVLVTLLEGEVVVTDAVGADQPRGADAGTDGLPAEIAAPVTLSPGQQLVAPADAPRRIEQKANLAKTNAWREGKVLLIDDSLEAAVARMNRYSRIRISVVGDGLEELRINGVFDAGDTDAFVEAIEAYFPVDARRTSLSAIEFHPRG